MDMGASVIARLKNKAKETGKPFQLHLQLFCQEEFLRRLAASRYAENLVLKGGLFIYTLTNFESRATVDIDFLLRQFPGTIEDIKRMVDEIIATDSDNDFITFSSRGFETISPQRKYTGVSFQLVGQIKNTRTPFDVDFGVGDVIVPNSHRRAIPVQLDGFDVPEVLTYSLESTIAEKFDALLQRLELTSRMKDIYDIYYLSSMFDFDGRALQQAVFETHQHGIHHELVKILGRLRYRTSYGQNVLQHSIEVSHIAGMMAAELGADVQAAKRAGLLHDIGKALDHEFEGTHVALGVEYARKYREKEDIIHAIQAHHGDVECKTLVACLVQAADAISAARPGARRENLENYIKRLEKLEEITGTYPGVEKSYAIQAGREVRVMVKPEQVSEDQMVILARELAKRIENELEYPGQIKVHVLRETKVVEYAK